MDIVLSNQQTNLTNKELIKITTKIRAAGAAIAKNMYSVAALLSEVADKKLYADDGFKNVADYAEQVFGFKRSTAYMLAKVGREYTQNNRSILTEVGETDFTVHQVAELLPLEKEQAQELVDGGRVSPEMPVAEIRKVVREVKPVETAETSEIVEANGNSDEDVGEPTGVAKDEWREFFKDRFIPLLQEENFKDCPSKSIQKAAAKLLEAINNF